MKYRVHLFVKVRVERELDADSAEEAARRAFEADLYQRFDRPGQEFAGEVDEVLLVDPLTDEMDRAGRRLHDYENARWLRVWEQAQPDGTRGIRVVPAPSLDLAQKSSP